MSKAQPWTVPDDGLDAREAARESARARGLSVGEWLQGAIAGGPEPATGSDEQPPRSAAPRSEASATARTEPASRKPRADSADRLPPRHAPEPEDDVLLDHFLADLERRTARNERRTDRAIAAVARMLEDNEERREQQQGSVAFLAQKLGQLETQHSHRYAGRYDNPVGGTLARLEARLDGFGQRGGNAIIARRRPADATMGTPVQRLEDKLSAILEAARPEPTARDVATSAVALDAVRTASRAGHRSLSEAIADISRHQDVLDRPAGAVASDAPRLQPDAPPPGEALVVALRDDMANLAAKVDGIRRDALIARQTRPARDGEFAALRAEIGAMSHSIGGLAPRDSVKALETSVLRLAEQFESSRERERSSVVEAVEGANKGLLEATRETADVLGGEMRRLGEKMDELASAGAGSGIDRLQRQMEDLREAVTVAMIPPPTSDGSERPADTRQLEHLVRELGRRFDAAQAPGADQGALDRLQKQVERLSDQFEQSEASLSALPTLTSSMRELFAEVEATRGTVETAAAQAAREVLKIAADQTRQHREQLGEDAPAPAGEDTRSNSTLDAVHAMLGKVVDRLTAMEHDLAEVRRRPEPVLAEGTPAVAAEAEPARPVLAAVQTPFLPDQPGAIRLGGMEPRSQGKKQAKAPRKPEGEPVRSGTSPGGQRSDFIAAARRAAALAQVEGATRHPIAIDKAARDGLLAKSRDYVATHRRPVLMGLAALMMALGAMALANRLSGGLGGGTELASNTVPAASVQTADVSPAAVPAAKDASPVLQQAAAAPTARAIAGIDTTPTASIPSLPAFAAGPAMQAPRATLPKGLVTAAEAGNVAAQYSLAVRYADGQLVPRDMKLAAHWFEKAAGAGSAPAQYRLGALYEKGIGVAADKAQAKALYLKAADAGNPRAMHNLAVMLADNDGHPDYAGAVAWFRKAAQFGVHDSQYNLAVLLGRGLGTPQDLVQSYRWFAVASPNDADAAKKREEVALRLSATDLAAAKALAAAFQAKAPDPAAVSVEAPSGGWDGAPAATRLNSPRSKVSSL